MAKTQMTPEQHASAIVSAFGQPMYRNRLFFAVKDAIEKSVAAEQERVIKALDRIKSDIGDLESVSGGSVRDSIDDLIASMQDYGTSSRLT